MKFSDLDPRVAAAVRVAKGGSEARKALRDIPEKKMGTPVIPFQAKRDADELETAKASSYKMRAIRWLWPNRFAIGKLGLIGGLPDKGKGLISCSVIA
jgi:hypothetical protein